MNLWSRRFQRSQETGVASFNARVRCFVFGTTETQRCRLA